jgi:hypothetical protein
MYKTKTLLPLLLALFTAIAIFSCSNIYYVGQTTSPLKLYGSTDTNSLISHIIPANSKVLTRKKSKKYYYLIFQSFKGYAYRPEFINYRRYNSAVDGQLYGYSSSGVKSASASSGSRGNVNVKGYYRKNGTYVKPYTRRAPSKRN